MKDLFLVLLTVAGGLGVFLLGMKHLSEGLQAVSGQGLRKFMGLATTHRAAGVGTGVVSTLIVQSSSIIIVMLVGFVSSGLMTLQQAINVIIGANVGTTGTVWIVAFAPSPQLLGLGGLAIGGLLYFFVHSETIHNLGLAVLGLGLVFLGLYFMSKGVMPIRQNPAVAAAFQAMDATTYAGIVKVALAAAVFTAVIQSSAASIAIAMTLASQHLISYEVAISVLFGANIGTTMTGWLAAIGSTSEAKRTALAHTLSNVIGTIVFLPFVPLLVKAGQAAFPGWEKVTVCLADGTRQVYASVAAVPQELFGDKSVKMALAGIMAPIAVTDTVFSVLRGLLTFPFVKPFSRLIIWLIPARNEEKPHLSFLNFRARQSPVIACDQAFLELNFMAESDIDLMQTIRKVLTGEAEEKDESHIFRREDILDNVQREITEFLGNVMASRLPTDVAVRARALLRLTDEFESVSDEAPAIVKVIHRLRKNRQKISETSCEALRSAHDRVYAFAEMVTSALKQPRGFLSVETAQTESREIHEFIRALRQRQLSRIGPEDPFSPMRVLVELDILNAYERIRSYYLNIAETLAGGKK